MKKNKKSLFILLGIAFLMWGISCKNDDEISILPEDNEPSIDSLELNICDSLIYLGEFNLMEESKHYFKYDTITNVYFRNSNGNQVKLTNETPGEYRYVNVIGSYPCQRNPYEEVVYKYRRNGIFSYLRNDSLQIEIKSLLSIHMETDRIEETKIGDIMQISVAEIDRWFKYVGNIIVDSRNMIEDEKTDMILHNEFTIINNTFTNVFSPDEDEENQLYYNENFGIIGFKDFDGNLWEFEKME